MALAVLSVVISKATAGGVSSAISLLLGCMPVHAIIQYSGMHPYTMHSPQCGLYFLSKRKVKSTCINASITSNSQERFLRGMPKKNTKWYYICFFQISFDAHRSSAMLQLERDPDKECQIHRHDMGSSSAETGHRDSNQHSVVWC